MENIDLNNKLAEEIPESTEEKAREEFSVAEYKEVKNMLKQLKEMSDLCRSTVEDNIREGYGLDVEIVNPEGGILGYTKVDIDAMTYDDITTILTRYGSEDNTKLIIEAFKDEGMSDEESARKILHDIKDSQVSLIENEVTYREGVEQAIEIGRQYREFLSSDIYRQKRDKMIANLKAEADAEPDEVKRNKMYRKIALYEETLSLDFFTKRLAENTAAEKKSIMKGFFNEQQGGVIIDKFMSKITKFGYKKDMYTRFFNMEETFLPKEYHVYNNLFLFLYMRFVSYADPYNETSRAYVKAITTNIVSLIYHQFANGGLEEEFLDFMKSTLDYFKDEYQKFDQDNTNHPNHPVALANRKRHEEYRKETIIRKMNDLNIEGYNQDASADELYDYMQNQIEEMQKAQAPKGDIAKVDVEEATEENPEGHVTVEPKFDKENAPEETDENQSSDENTSNSAEEDA